MSGKEHYMTTPNWGGHRKEMVRRHESHTKELIHAFSPGLIQFRLTKILGAIIPEKINLMGICIWRMVEFVHQYVQCRLPEKFKAKVL